jgi:hypothetical protein
MILHVGTGRQEGIPSPNFYLIVLLGHSPLSIQSLGHSPLSSLPRAGPTTRAIRRQASIHMASTHCGVDLASSNGRKALGVDGHPIVPHRQIQWV